MKALFVIRYVALAAMVLKAEMITKLAYFAAT
jgi:hypothetical protein